MAYACTSSTEEGKSKNMLSLYMGEGIRDRNRGENEIHLGIRGCSSRQSSSPSTASGGATGGHAVDGRACGCASAANPRLQPAGAGSPPLRSPAAAQLLAWSGERADGVRAGGWASTRAWGTGGQGWRLRSSRVLAFNWAWPAGCKRRLRAWLQGVVAEPGWTDAEFSWAWLQDAK